MAGRVGGSVRDERDAQQPGFTTERIHAESYQAGIATFWELDLFGRVRRGVQAAAADAEAAEADLRDAQVLVAAEVANTYLDLRGAQKRLRVAQANLANQRETLDLTRVRLDLGRGSELDVASASCTIRGNRSEHSARSSQPKSIAAHRLAVLLGESPGALASELAPRELAPHLTTLAGRLARGAVAAQARYPRRGARARGGHRPDRCGEG